MNLDCFALDDDPLPLAAGQRVNLARFQAGKANGGWHEAAKELAESLGWHGDYVAGSTRDGYVFVRLISNGNTPANVFRVHEETCA